MLLLLWICISFGAWSQQIHFSRIGNEDGLGLTYKWRDHSDREQSLKVTLPTDALKNDYQSIKTYRPEVAQRHVYVELMKEAQQIDPREARVTIIQRRDRLEISVTSRNPEAISVWRNTMAVQQQQAFQNYLSDNYYTEFQTYFGKTAIRPDHIRFIEESRPALVLVAQEIFAHIGAGYDSREYVDFVLSMLQTMPYNDLQKKDISRGAGYLPPLDVLKSNVGDCDSKSALAAGLLRSLFPNLSIVMVYLPDHALLAANLSRKASEATVTIDGMEYLLLEPTGPAMFPAGEIALTSRQKIQSGMFSYAKIP